MHSSFSLKEKRLISVLLPFYMNHEYMIIIRQGNGGQIVDDAL